MNIQTHNLSRIQQQYPKAFEKFIRWLKQQDGYKHKDEPDEVASIKLIFSGCTTELVDRFVTSEGIGIRLSGRGNMCGFDLEDFTSANYYPVFAYSFYSYSEARIAAIYAAFEKMQMKL